MGEITRIEFWKHYGAISQTNIIKKTGCSRVLAEAFGKKNIPGEDLIGVLPYGDKKPTICKCWEFYFYLNQAYLTMIPIPFESKNKLRKTTVRVEPNVHENLRLWTEVKSRHYKVGKHLTNNEFILIWES